MVARQRCTILKRKIALVSFEYPIFANVCDALTPASRHHPSVPTDAQKNNN